MAESAVHRQILASMAGGVMSLAPDGRIATFNPAAGRILSLDPAAVVGSSYAEVFLLDAGLEELNELVLKAVYEQELTHSREIDLARQGRRVSLSVSTSLLRDPADGRSLGVVVVVDDVTERRKRRKLLRVFGEYHDARVLDRLLAAGDELASPERRRMTVAFCDLVGFTTLAEAIEPGRLVGFLNAYIGRMTAAVAATEGVTDKIIGDAVMAFWGAPFTEREPAAAACECALAQLAALEELRADARGLGLPMDPMSLDLRIGIATGDVVAGSIGPPGARSFTVVGDAVNVAARLEVANKELGTRITVCADTRAAAGAGFAFRSMGSLQLRGRARPSPVFTLEGRGQAAGAVGSPRV